ncbi:MAG: sugar phosphate nucleotidyltransferase [Bryobacteraceae bacterium]
MKVRKALITAAGRNQRTLPLQALIDRDGVEKPVLRIILDQVLEARIEEVCLVVCPGDEAAYGKAAGEQAGRLQFVPQAESLGYAHAVYCARDFVDGEPFLHLVGDHIYVSPDGGSSARPLIETAEAEACAVSAVQPTRETQLAHYGAVGGQRVSGRADLYRIETVIEKPTPTEAERQLIVPGLRAGFYLCFFGMHVLTPAVMEILGEQLASGAAATLSGALAELARRQQYLALHTESRRYDLGVRYGLLTAQVALALAGRDRSDVLAQLLELVATRGLEASAS